MMERPENVTKEAAFEAAVIAASLALRQGHGYSPGARIASGSRDN
jgi:hypothetical protein